MFKTSRQKIVAVTFTLFAILVLLPCGRANAESLSSESYCGVADGYPPYQFQGEDMSPTGVDVEVLELVFQHLDTRLLLRQGKWDDMVAYLRLGEMDCIGGMEINGFRRDYFDFTTPYYNRKIVVFVREENEEIQSIDDLIYRIIAGDRHSFVDNYFKQKGLRTQIRIRNTKSKDESMRMLRDNEVVAMIAPVAVGMHLAKRYNVAVRIIDNEDPGSPVGIAVEKGNTELLSAIEEALVKTMKDGTLEEVLSRWKIQ